MVGGFLLLHEPVGAGQIERLIKPLRDTERAWSGAGQQPHRRTEAGRSRTTSRSIKARPVKATVNITSTVYRRNFFFEIVPSQEMGSGFFINPDGRILTNNHVIRGSARSRSRRPITTAIRREVLVRDRADDLALIQIDPAAELPVPEAGRFRRAAGRPKGAGHRQSVRFEAR